MAEEHPLLTVEQYRERVLAAVTPTTRLPAGLRDALGLIAAEDVDSQIALPSFDNSSMDGYAVHASDVAGAGAGDPVRLPVIGEIGAGHAAPDHLPPGAAAKIMTGAALPPGADAVVPYEWTDRGASQVAVFQAPHVGQHIRREGDDIRPGDRVLSAGTAIGPRQVALLAAVGRAEVVVHARPRVAIISTGTELRSLGEPLGPNALYDSNSALLAACVEQVGATVVHAGHVADEPDEFLALVDGLADADLVLTSGGISMGDYDIVKATLAPRGLWFGGVAMQPGKPQGFGRVGDALLLALPGNPVSVFVSFHQFVLPALRRLMGETVDISAPHSATLLTAITSPMGRRQFLRGRRSIDGRVEPVGGAGSHLLGGLADADCLIVVDEERTEVAAGETVGVIDLGVL